MIRTDTAPKKTYSDKSAHENDAQNHQLLEKCK